MSLSEILDFYFGKGHIALILFAIASFALGMFIDRTIARGNILFLIIFLLILGDLLRVFCFISSETPFHWGFFLSFEGPFIVGFLSYTIDPMIRRHLVSEAIFFLAFCWVCGRIWWFENVFTILFSLFLTAMGLVTLEQMRKNWKKCKN